MELFAIVFDYEKTGADGYIGGIIDMKREMKVIDWTHVIAGIFILVSLALGTLAHPYWYFFTAFVGLNLFQFGFTGFCLVGLSLKKLGVPE